MKKATTPTYRDDLEWLFWECESQMGLKSNFNSLILASKYGSKRIRIDDGEIINGVQEDLFNEDTLIDAIDTRRALGRLAATKKNRKVMLAFSRLNARHQRILSAFYEPKQFPPDVRRVFGELAGVVPLTATALSREEFDMDWLSLAILKKNPSISQMQREASEIFGEALRSFAKKTQQVHEAERMAVVL